MQRDITYLNDIYQSVQKIIAKTSGITFDKFDSDYDLQDIVIRRFTIIGEASNRLSEAFRSKYPQLPYKSMRGMRNFIVHEYNEIDTEIIWKTSREEIPFLARMIEGILSTF